MSDEIMNVQTGQSGDLGGNAVQQNVNGSYSAGVNNQSPDADTWAQREKDFLTKAYQQAQSLVDKSANRQVSQFQGMIDQFKAEYGVTLTPEQVQEMALNRAVKSMPNVQGAAQQPLQQAPATDPSFQGFMYYHGMNNNSEMTPLYKQMFDLQNTLGVQLEKTDAEYQKFIHPEKKYTKAEFVAAWKQACIDKIVRLQSAQGTEPADEKKSTNLGQMPLVGSRGKKSNDYDPKRSTKSYVEEYMRNLNERK